MKIKNTKIRISLQNCFYGLDPDLIMNTDYVLIEKKEKWELRIKVEKYGEKAKICRYDLSDQQIYPSQFLDKIKRLKIPIVTKIENGLDGDYTELEIYQESGGIKLKWWAFPPKGWEELGKATSEFVQILNNFRISK